MAGEPETLDSDEPLPRKIHRHNYDRLLMLSDGVFAIAITLLVLDLRPPHEWSGSLPDLVRNSWRALFGYVFGFAAVAGFWAAHRALFARLRHVDGPATALSLLLLLFIGLVPAAAALASVHGLAKGMPVYLLLVATIAGVQSALWAYAAFLGNLVDSSISYRDRVIRTALLLTPLVIFGYLFAVPATSLSLWTASPLIVLVVVARILRRRMSAR